MQSKLIIQNFKRIEEKITLNDFATVNYFVGKNGSGKSSVLSAISFLADPRDGSNSRHFFNEDSIVDLQIFDENGVRRNALVWNDGNPNKVDSQLETNFRLLYVEENPDKGANGAGKAELPVGNPDKATFQFVNDTLKLLELSPFETEKIVSDDPWDDDAGKRIYKHRGKPVNLNLIATGIKSFLKFRYGIEQAMGMSTLEIADGGCILIIEEPENNMHPSLQKRIPIFLKNLMETLSKEFHTKLQIYISTHSPFVIAAASSYAEQKVYILEEGLLVDLEGNLINESSGYSGSECAAVVAQMLGAGVIDLGYPENYCILEEYSMQLILENCKKSGLLKDFQFVSASGESNVVKYADRMDDLWKLSNLITCNPFYQDKYHVIVDKTEKQNDKFEKVKNRLGDRFHELQNFSLEDYYPNFSENLAHEFIAEYAAAKGNFGLQGQKKREFAEKVAELIKSKEDFSKLFNSELDFLLKE